MSGGRNLYNWDFFDAIFCINLEKDAQRRKEVENVFSRLSIPAKFFKGILDKISNKGCLESHKRIYNLSLEKGYNKILIFEDDIIPTDKITSSKLKYCTDFMETHPWDIFYFGAVPSVFNYFQEKTSTKYVYKIRGICTHAYALSKSALQKLKDIEWKPEEPLDYILRNDDSLEKYAVYPTFFNQQTNYKVPEGLLTLSMRVNEFYAYHVGIPAKYFMAVLLVLAAVLIVWKIFRTRRKTK